MKLGGKERPPKLQISETLLLRHERYVHRRISQYPERSNLGKRHFFKFQFQRRCGGVRKKNAREAGLLCEGYFPVNAEQRRTEK